MRDLHLRRVTETASTSSKKASETSETDPPLESKALPWDNLALRERIAEAEEVTHRSVTSELHTAARHAIDGRPTRSTDDRDTWSAQPRDTRSTVSRGTWSEELQPTPAPSRGTWSEQSRGPGPIPAAPHHDPRPVPVQAPAREPWWKRLSDELNLTGSAHREP